MNQFRVANFQKLVLCSLLLLSKSLLANDIYAPRFINHQHKTDKLIIFIHGLYGNPTETWTNTDSQNPAYWPELLSEDPTLRTYDSYVAGYETSNIGIDDIAENVLEDLRNKKIFDDYENIYVIAHSLGGLVFKELIWKMSLDKDKNRRKFKAVFFLATPSSGTSLPDYLKSILKIKAERMKEKPALELLSKNCPCDPLKTFESNWINYRRSFAFHHDGFPLPQAYCAVENKPWSNVVPVVNYENLVTQIDVPIRTIDADHIAIAKPKDVHSPIFTWVKTSILGMEEKLKNSSLETDR